VYWGEGLAAFFPHVIIVRVSQAEIEPGPAREVWPHYFITIKLSININLNPSAVNAK
jgi:hypothetical protein